MRLRMPKPALLTNGGTPRVVRQSKVLWSERSTGVLAMCAVDRHSKTVSFRPRTAREANGQPSSEPESLARMNPIMTCSTLPELDVPPPPGIVDVDLWRWGLALAERHQPTTANGWRCLDRSCAKAGTAPLCRGRLMAVRLLQASREQWPQRWTARIDAVSCGFAYPTGEVTSTQDLACNLAMDAPTPSQGIGQRCPAHGIRLPADDSTHIDLQVVGSAQSVVATS